MLSLTEDRVLSCLISLVATQMEVSRHSPILPAERQSWTADTSLGPEGLDLSPGELSRAVAAVAGLFHLRQDGVRDLLMTHRRLADWTQLVLHSLAGGHKSLCFRGSGVTGTPEPVIVLHETLADEVEALAQLLRGVRRVISFLPAHERPGFLTTVALPGHLGVPVVEGLGHAPATLRRLVQPDDLVVAHPTVWAYLSRALDTFTPGLVGLSCSAPLPADLQATLHRQGLATMLDVYDSTALGAVGYRWQAEAPFTLVGCWRRQDRDHLVRSGTGAVVQMPDHVDWMGSNRFRPLVRRAQGVAVAGILINARQVAAQIEAHPAVREAAVTLDPATGRLQASVVPLDQPDDPAPLLADLTTWCQQTLEARELPQAITLVEDNTEASPPLVLAEPLPGALSCPNRPRSTAVSAISDKEAAK